MKAKVTVIAGLLVVCLSGAARCAEGAKDVPLAIPAGYRGMGIPLPGSQIPFIKKGNRLDVYVTFDAQMKDGKEKVTATILQNVLVWDVKRSEKPDQDGAIEVIVNPNEAQYLALAFVQGSVRVSKRAEGDTEMKPMEMAAFRKLFSK